MRLSLFEFEDQPWFPDVLRDYQTGFIGFTAGLGKLYDTLKTMPLLTEVRQVTDLASGAGTPAIEVTEQMRKNGGTLLLTDKFPNKTFAAAAEIHPGVSYAASPTDVMKHCLPAGELYTMFNAFHHFTFREKADILRKISARGGKVLITEPLQPNVTTFLKVAVATLIGPFLLTPFIRPLTLSRVFFTYLLPVGVFVTFWDGMASVFRAVSKREYLRLRDILKKEGIDIEYGTLSSRSGPVTYLRFR